MATSTFVPVGSDGTSLRLGDIVPTNFDGANGDTVQFFNLNGSGSVSTTAWYFAGYGWFDFNTNESLDDMLIPAGTGLFVTSTQTGAEFVVSGEVVLQSTTLTLPVGYTVVGNSSPVSIVLGDIVPNANFDGAFGDTIQFFDPTGSGVVTTTAWYFAGYGWFDFNTSASLDSMVINPGDSFFANATQSNVSFTFPAVL
jgi:hydrogenase maturation factor HypE